MKKTLLTCLILVAISLGLFVACNAEAVIPEDTNGVAYIRFGECDVRSFTASYDIADYENLYWFYTATKDDNYGKYGVTKAETPVATYTTGNNQGKPAKGLDTTAVDTSDTGTITNKIGPFSQGKWKFTLAAYSELKDDGTSPDTSTMVYATKNTKKEDLPISVSLLGGETKTIPATVNAVGETGSIAFGKKESDNSITELAYFKWKNNSSGAVSGDKPVLTITMTSSSGTTYTLTNDTSKLGTTNGNTIAIVLGDYVSEKGYPIRYVKATDSSSWTTTLNGFAVGYYGVIVSAYLSGNESTPVAQETSFAFRVYGGATTVISGNITEDPDQYATFDVAKTEIITQLAATEGATTVTASSVPDTSTLSGTTKTTKMELAEGILTKPESGSESGSKTDVSVVVLVEASSAEKASETFTLTATDSTGKVVNNSIKISATEIKTTASATDGTKTETKDLKNWNNLSDYTKAPDNTESLKYATIETYVEPGLTTSDYSNSSGTCDLKIYYEGQEDKTVVIEQYTTGTGYLKFKTPHFSEFYLVSSENGAFYSKSLNRTFSTFAKAIEKASDIQLSDSATLDASVDNSKAVDLDLNGKTLTVSGDGKFKVASALTIKNGTITSETGNLFEVKNKGNLTLENVTASGTLSSAGTETALLSVVSGGSASVKDSTLSLTNGVGIASAGTLTLDNTTVTGGAYGVVLTSGKANITNGTKIVSTTTTTSETGAPTSAALYVKGKGTTAVLGNNVTLTNSSSDTTGYQLYVNQESDSDNESVKVEGTVDSGWKVNTNSMNGAYYPGFEAKIGNHHYPTLKDALEATGTIDLVDNAVLSDATTITIAKTINLNGYTLTTERPLTIGSGDSEAEVKLKGGSIVSTTTEKSGIVLKSNMSLVLDNVNFEAVYKRGIYIEEYMTDCSLTIKNGSNIVGNVFAVQTNASVKDGKTAHIKAITIKDSTLKAKNGSDQDNAGLLINVPVDSVDISGSTISGQRQGAILRGGTANAYKISNTTFESRGTVTSFLRNDGEGYESHYENCDWETGNGVPLAALVIGNKGGAYAYPTTVELSNVTLKVGESAVRKGLYIYQADKDATVNKVTVSTAAGSDALSAGSVATINTSVNGATVSVNQGENYYVSGLDNLNAALAVADYVSLLDNVSVKVTGATAPAVAIKKSLILEGNGHQLLSSSRIDTTNPLVKIKGGNENTRCIIEIRNLDVYDSFETKRDDESTKYIADARIVEIENLENGDLKFENVNIVSEGYGSRFRGINVFDSKNAKITLKDSKVILPHYYALDIRPGCEKAELVIEDCEIEGYCSIYNHGSEVTVTARNSTFVANNPETKGGSTNSFSAVIVSEYYNQVSGEKSADNTMTFTDCIFKVSVPEDTENVTQKIADLRSPCNNTLYLDGCSYAPAKGSQYFISCYDSTYKGNKVEEKYKGTNKIVVDSVDITCSDKVSWYVDDADETSAYKIEYKGIEDASLTKESTYTYWYFGENNSGLSTTVDLPILTRTGSTFGGWYTEATFENKKESVTSVDNQNFTLYAKWNEN